MNNNKKHLCLGRKFLYRLKDKKNGIIAIAFQVKWKDFMIIVDYFLTNVINDVQNVTVEAYMRKV
jgi:hypothetical protein